MTTSRPATIRQVAVLGTGAMGAPIANNIAKKGFRVRVWNRTKANAKTLTEGSIDISETAAEAVHGADVVLTMLSDGAAVLDVMRAAAPSLKAGAIWAQMSTVGAEAIPSLVSFAAEHELVFLDSPVQGSRQPAQSAQLVILASGPVAARDVVQPVYDAIGKRTLWVSEDAAGGASSRLKLALNHYAFALTHGIAESLRIAQGLGVDPHYVIDVVTGGPMDNAYLQMKGSAILAGDFTPSFNIANAVKDAKLISAAARSAGLHTDVADASLARFKRALDQGHGDADMAASFLAG
jgi:3-hydroxyisobutyrate dehydrogenase